MNCSVCTRPNKDSHRFCGYCGSPIQPAGASARAESIFHDSAPVVQRARLRLVRGEGREGRVFPLDAQKQSIGRELGEIVFQDDKTVSPTHATFYYEDGRLFVRDESSLNGTFARIQQAVPIAHGEIFLCGEQVLIFEFHQLMPVHIGVDAAIFCGTPVEAWSYRVAQLMGQKKVGLALCTSDPVLTIGREGCDLNFAQDRFISRNHARIEFRESNAVLRDLDSRNGTYFRLKEPVPLSHGDQIFIGRQLLRVELV
jgi:pSer/pThr/pTyr-binding forkhead associated (FHA) protein